MLPELWLIPTQVFVEIEGTEIRVSVPELSMPNRAAKFASAILVSLVASVPFTATSRGAAGTDDECLSAPKGDTHQGSHWYYRIDRASKRQCWYLRDEGEKSANAAPPKLSSPVKPAPGKTEVAMQTAIADARAELPPQARSLQPGRENRPAAPITATAPLSEADKAAQPPVAETQPSVVASRWVDQSNAFAVTNPGSLASPAPSEPSAVAEVSAAPQVPAQVLAQAQPALAPAAGQFTAMDLSSDTPTHSVQMLLAAIMGALALAGVMGRLIFNFVGTRRRAKRKLRGRRGAIWKSAKTGRKGPPVYQGADALPQPHFPRDLDQVGDPDDRIVELLRDFSRKSRRGPKERQPGVGSLL
jgi:hypothetical protein